MFIILVIVILLVAWSLHLMEEAVAQQEFSLMLAGFLVAVAAAAMVAVYFLMGHYVGYMQQAAHASEYKQSLTSAISQEGKERRASRRTTSINRVVVGYPIQSAE